MAIIHALALAWLCLLGMVRTPDPATPPACPPWCRMHGVSRTGVLTHMRVISTVFDDANPALTIEINLLQDDGQTPAYVRVFFDENESGDLPLTVAAAMGRVLTEMRPDDTSAIGKALLSAYILAGGAR